MRRFFFAPLLVLLACGSDDANAPGNAGSSDAGSSSGGDATTASDAGGGSSSGGPSDAAHDGPTGTTSDGGLPAGWLFTKGNAIYVADGNGGGTRWMGRGVNVDDLFLCGYDNTLQMTNAQQTLGTIYSGLVAGWKPTFVRVSLGMASYKTVSWSSNASDYATPMTRSIEGLGAHPGVYVLVTLRSDSTMTGQDTASGDAEATGLPANATDAVYTALVDAFAHDAFVLFGLSNEPGGNTLTNDAIAAAMDHAVGTIRAEEDKLGVPHHLVSVQGNGWTSDISFYATKPLNHDDVIYEVHGYPPTTASYTYSNIPVILGEYGSLADSNAFYADVESKQIPNLAWDFEPYSNCSPDLLGVTTNASQLTPTAWGQTVQAYLLAH